MVSCGLCRELAVVIVLLILVCVMNEFLLYTCLLKPLVSEVPMIQIPCQRLTLHMYMYSIIHIHVHVYVNEYYVHAYV